MNEPAKVEKVTSHSAQSLADSLASANKKDLSKRARSIFCQMWQDETMMRQAGEALEKLGGPADLIAYLKGRTMKAEAK